MTVNVIKFSQFAAANLNNTTNMLVGVSSPSGGTNFQVSETVRWTTAGRPSSPYLGLSGFNTTIGQPEYWNGSSWIQLAAGGSGTVNTGAINQLAWYAANGTAVSGLNTANSSILTTDSGGVPVWSTTLPSGLTIPIPNITGVTDGSNAASGSVEQFVSSVILSGSAIPLTTTVLADITSISLTAGDWDVWGNAFFITSSQLCGGATWLSASSATQPDPAIVGQYNVPAGIQNIGACAPSLRFNLTVTTTIYISCGSVFGSGTVSVCGGIYARRRR